VEERLRKRVEALGTKPQPGILGVNLGKNKEQTDAAADYVTGLKKLGGYADYIVINVSSPNTPGLRALQGEKELSELISRVMAARAAVEWKGRTQPPPLLVKIAPDLNDLDKEQIARVVLAHKVDGLIISNTTGKDNKREKIKWTIDDDFLMTVVSREGLASENKKEVGGMSGKPLFDKSTQTLADMYKLTRGGEDALTFSTLFEFASC